MNIPTHKLALVGLVLFFLPHLVSALPVNWLAPDLERAQAQAQQEDKLFILYFTADWCLPCQWMQQHTFQDDELLDYLHAHILTVKVDLNQAQAKVLQHQFEVEAIPSILVFAPNGKLLDRNTASMEARPLLRWLKKLDKPTNHLRATLPLIDQQTALDAPQAEIAFSRPALIPEEEAPALLSNATYQEENTSSPMLVLSGEPLAAVQPGFAPRSGLSYGIQLKNVLVDYPTAVRMVTEIERKYEQSTELKPNGEGLFFLVLGNFPTTGKARQFLVFLQRNDREGEIVPLVNN
ncbi:thioredoxin family protein [Lewinella sp. LCG006]|uniref:thioredoxin family protein n=1 Tax=Lewinella sp. LCG006 TaxID=3231911 RepID=UPI00345F6CC9